MQNTSRAIFAVLVIVAQTASVPAQEAFDVRTDQLMPRHISDDAEYRRAQRFRDNAPEPRVEVGRLSTAQASRSTPHHISDDAEYRRAQRFRASN